MSAINIPAPKLQISFSFLLGEMRKRYLQDALSETVQKIDITELDNQLGRYVPKKNLSQIASLGIRGELLFPVPIILESNPNLIAYYRLMLGFSKKEFYTKKFGIASLASMEEKGVITSVNTKRIPDVCRALIDSALSLIDGIGIKRISKDILDDLALLTLGPQLRGSANVEAGVTGIAQVFKIISDVVEKTIVSADLKCIQLVNASGRNVFIEFAPDPDIVIREELAQNRFRNLIAIEVKAGKDYANVHNRIGEAEKSHQKARGKGFIELWTVVNVEHLDIDKARKESPTTNQFYLLPQILANEAYYNDFKYNLCSIIGIRA